MRICRCPRPVVSFGTAAICAVCTGIVPVHHAARFKGSGPYHLAASMTDQTDQTGPHQPEVDYSTYIEGAAEYSGTISTSRFTSEPPTRSFPGAAPTTIMFSQPTWSFRVTHGTVATL